MRGLLPHEIMCKFPVIVAVQDDFRKNRAKCTKYLHKCYEMLHFTLFRRKYTSISIVFF